MLHDARHDNSWRLPCIRIDADYYKVGNGSKFSKVNSFKTLPAPGTTGKMRIGVIADIGELLRDGTRPSCQKRSDWDTIPVIFCAT